MLPWPEANVLFTSAAGRWLLSAAVVAALPSAVLGQVDTSTTRPSAREVTVTAGDAHITVRRIARLPVEVRVETNAGTFVVAGDSSLIAQWADSADGLPDPRPLADTNAHPMAKAWQVVAKDDSHTSLQLARVADSSGTDMRLTASNGAWSTYEYLGAQRQAVLDALRGTLVDTTGTANVTSKSLVVDLSRCLPPRVAGPDSAIGRPAFCHAAQHERQARLTESRPPVYPPSLQSQRISGRVLMQFIVDTTGRAEQRTIRVISATRPEFAWVSFQALLQSRFEPAQVDGRRVRELVQMPFDFNMR